MANDPSFQALIELSSDILAQVKDDGRVVLINQSVKTLLGHVPEDLIGSDILDLVHPEEQISLLARLRDPDPDPNPFDVRFRATSGHWIFFETLVRSSPSTGVENQPAGALVRARTIAAEKRYERLFEESRDAIVMGTLEGRIVDINPAGVSLFGFDSKEEMLQINIAQDLYWNPEDRKTTGALFRSQGYMQDTEIELRTKDGRKIRVVESASAVRDPRGNLIGFRGFLRDVTEHRRLEEQLRQSQKMEAVGRLAGGVAHDFNNLLTAVNGYSELVLARMAREDSNRNALEEIRKAGKRATELTRRLLTLSHHQVVSPRSISLNRAVLNMEKLLQRVLGEDIMLRSRLDQNLAPIFADQSQIEQVILNLAVNARDAMPDGGTLELQTRSVRVPEDLPPPSQGPKSGELVMLRAHDTGRGMTQKVRERAFEPFFTTKEHDHNTGLGLAIVYGIVTQANGFIEVESHTGKGTSFCLYFPSDTPDRGAVEKNTLTPRGFESVLVVEDDASVRALVKQILELHGYQISTAENATAALEILERTKEAGTVRPGLLLTDVVMPTRGGLSLASEVSDRYDTMKILFMSGYSDTHSDVRLIAQRKLELIPKPFSPDSLARKVRAVLDA